MKDSRYPRDFFVFLCLLSVCSKASSAIIIHGPSTPVNDDQDTKNETLDLQSQSVIDDFQDAENDSLDLQTVVNDDDDLQETNNGTLNLRPIIGILAQETSRKMKGVGNFKNYSSYIAASYVKFVESAGARVVPVLVGQPDEYYQKLVHVLNGFLFPGGGTKLSTGKYSKTAKKIYDLVIESSDAGNSIPIFATCMGFELVGYFVAGTNPLTRCQASARADPLYFKEGYESSKIFSNMPNHILKNLKTKNTTSNFHKYCILPKTFYDLGMNSSFNILSTSFDDLNLEYISTFEHRTLPIYGTQWHPEKAPFEWLRNRNIPHDFDSIEVAQYFANFYISEARKNFNAFPSIAEEEAALIYNYNPVFVRMNYKSSFQQCYFFP